MILCFFLLYLFIFHVVLLCTFRIPVYYLSPVLKTVSNTSRIMYELSQINMCVLFSLGLLNKCSARVRSVCVTSMSSMQLQTATPLFRMNNKNKPEVSFACLKLTMIQEHASLKQYIAILLQKLSTL